VLVGDFNAFPFNDGYVDTLGTIVGMPAPSNEVTLASADLVSPNLINLIAQLPEVERYSYNFSGNAQALDHMLVNVPMQSRLARFQYARCDADFPESYRSNFNRPERVSDHDVPIAFVRMFLSPLFTDIRRLPPGGVELFLKGEAGQTVGLEVSADLKDWEPAGTVTFDGAGAGSFVELNAPTGLQRFYRASLP
jgi:hypothetical protein